MANTVSSILSNTLAPLAPLSSLSKLKATALTLEHKFVDNAKAWIPIIGFAVMVMLTYFGVLAKLLDYAFYLVCLLVALHYIGQYVVDICNAAVECVKERMNGEIEIAKLQAQKPSVTIEGSGHVLNMTNASLAATHNPPAAPSVP